MAQCHNWSHGTQTAKFMVFPRLPERSLVKNRVWTNFPGIHAAVNWANRSSKKIRQLEPKNPTVNIYIYSFLDIIIPVTISDQHVCRVESSIRMKKRLPLS